MAAKNDDDNLPLKAAAEQFSPPAAPEKKSYPKKIVVTHLYGYYDDLNRYRSWKAGDQITDESEIKLLVDRGAPFNVVEE
jgi:hypothetical protein